MASSTTTTKFPFTNGPIKCPIFTYSGYDTENRRYFCDFKSWAYGVLAIAAILLIVLPIVILICCIATYRSKKRTRRLRGDRGDSVTTTTSQQPLLTEETNHENPTYGSIEGFSPPQSPGIGSISERRSNDNVSMESKASLMPIYDQSSLDARNNKTGNLTYQSSYDYQEPLPRPERLNSASSILSNTNSQFNITRSSTNSPIYMVPEEASPAGHPCPSKNDPEYSVLEGPNDSTISDTEKTLASYESVRKPESVLPPEEINTKGLQNGVNDDIMTDLSTEPNNRASDKGPIYCELENPALVIGPESDKSFTNQNGSQQDLASSVKNGNTDEQDSNEFEEPRYMPLVFGEQCAESTPAVPKERTVSRSDYQDSLMEVLESYPVNERNGCFILRDSISSPGSKALTVYSKAPDCKQEFYNFKICFDEDGQVYLAKSKKTFHTIEELLNYLRINKDMLPCTLTAQIT